MAADDVRALAAALVEGGTSVALPQPLEASTGKALAWALKAEAYSAWSTAPARTAGCAEALQRLDAQAGDAEVSALRTWVDGIAALAAGHIELALETLRAAHTAFSGLGMAAAAAETVVPQVVALSLLGHHDAALATGRQALAAFEALGDARSSGKIELNLATLLTRLQRAGEAAALYRSAAVRFARLGDLEHSVMADVGLANALTLQLDLDEALRINERARVRAARLGFPVLEAHAQGAIGRIELRRGRHSAALRALADALSRLETAQVAPHRLIEAEMALADAYAAIHLLPEAGRLFGRVAERAQALAAPTERAWALLRRAQVHTERGLASSARQSLEEAGRLFREIAHPAQGALADLALGSLLLQHGDAAEAKRLAEAAADALGGLGVGSLALEARVLAAEAELRPELEPADLQSEAELQARAVRRRRLGEHLDVLRRAAADSIPLRLRCELALGTLAAAEGQRDRARGHLSACASALDLELAALPGDEYRVAAAARAEAVHRQLAALALDEGDAALLWAALERGRNLVGREVDGPASAASRATRQAQEELAWQRERWQAALRRNDDRAQLTGFEQALRAAEHAWQEARRRDGLAVDAGHAGTRGTDTPSWPESAAQAAPWADRLCAALGPARALVHYHATTGGWGAIVATAHGVRHVDLGRECNPVEGVQALRFQIDSLRFGQERLVGRHAAQLMDRVRARARELHSRLWAPLAPLLDGCDDVVVIGHGVLHELPFAALHDGSRWLVQRHRLVHAVSAQAWMQASPRGGGAPAGRVLAIGHGAAELPQVELEVRAVCAAHGQRARALLGEDASLHGLRAAAADARVLHLACHAHFRSDNPAFSALYLVDGPLALHELAQWRLTTDLAVLSACETGRGQLAAGDEVLGLTRTLRRAGVREVLASLWPVQDEATAELMAGLHRALAGGLPPAAALQQAQRAAIAGGRHPFHWAAFVLHGH